MGIKKEKLIEVKCPECGETASVLPHRQTVYRWIIKHWYQKHRRTRITKMSMKKWVARYSKEE